jgi:hypothetical protein
LLRHASITAIAIQHYAELPSDSFFAISSRLPLRCGKSPRAPLYTFIFFFHSLDITLLPAIRQRHTRYMMIHLLLFFFFFFISFSSSLAIFTYSFRCLLITDILMLEADSILPAFRLLPHYDETLISFRHIEMTFSPYFIVIYYYARHFIELLP